MRGGKKIESKSFSHTLLVFSSLVVLWTNLIVGVQTAARGAVCVFCRSRLETQEKVQRVILQKTQSRRRDRECYKAIPPRSSCRQDQRQRRKPVWMRDYETGESVEEVDEEFAFHISNDDHVNFEEAVKEKKWQEAMELEIQAIERNQTWELVTLSHQEKKIGVKWVFKTKLNEEGKLDKCKARLVAKGYSQKARVDYNEVYALVARWDTIRILVAVAAQRGWCIYQLDVKSAFLYDELNEEEYVDQPEGFVKIGEKNKVYRLRKALYGLKQAPRA